MIWLDTVYIFVFTYLCVYIYDLQSTCTFFMSQHPPPWIPRSRRSRRPSIAKFKRAVDLIRKARWTLGDKNSRILQKDDSWRGEMLVILVVFLFICTYISISGKFDFFKVNCDDYMKWWWRIGGEKKRHRIERSKPVRRRIPRIFFTTAKGT